MKLLSVVAACALVSAGIEAKTFLFPAPQDIEWSGSTSTLSNNFKFRGIKNDRVQKAAKRYANLIKDEKWTPVQVSTDNSTVTASKGKVEGIRFDVADNKAKLDYGIDESYTLNVPTDGYATVTAKTWVGALRALETFSQLVIADKKKLTIHGANITDAPTFPHRGISLDTSRNFYPVKDILRTIEAQAYNKMNVLHWHVTDSQSWPLEVKSHPELSKNGAYSEDEIYSIKDVQNIIDFAADRGVRVIAEFDVPAHTDSIAPTYPEYMLCSGPQFFWDKLAAEPPAGQLDPLNEDAYKLVQDVTKEITERFPDSFYHSGGDEINSACWETDEKFVEYTKNNNVTTHQVWFDWTQKFLKYITKDLKKRPIIWEDSIKDGAVYPNNTVVQSWIAPPANYTSKGYDVIVSNFDYFYLDCGHGGWVGDDERYISPTQTETPDDLLNYGGTGASWCAPFKTWQRIYSFDMTYGTEGHDGKVIGGEAALWSEQSGPTVLDGRLWPRAAAAAELYWSGSYDNKGTRRTVKTVSERFYDWVYRLQARGIDAEPVQPKYCAKHPHACDLHDPKESQ